ncbi:unnamed protein product, partial [Rotaria sordida]
MASWAYYILYSSTNPTGYGNWQWSRELHYITTPGAIKNYTKRLVNELDDIQQKEALYFLIHFISDIYQPLHTAFASYFMNETFQTNLHVLWDVDLMMVRLERDFQQDTFRYYDYIYQLMLNQSSCNDDDNNIEQL